MDLFDAATELEEAQRQAALARHRARPLLAATARDDCTDCGADIPPARRAAVPHATRCVACEARAERR